MAVILDGKALAEKIKNDVRASVEKLKQARGITPGLATVLVGDDPASHVYVKNKLKATKACGMKSFHYALPGTVAEAELLKLIQDLNRDPAVHGILLQMPLPKHIDAQKVILAIDPQKDVDGFHPFNMGRLLIGQETLLPCTPAGIMEILKHYKIEARGKDALVVGRSNIVGKPMAALLINAGATVTVANSQTQNLPDKLRQADIVVAAVGKANFIQGDWIRLGAVVIDVGINRQPDGKLCGDVDFSGAQVRASCITPVPGGVGPMTIAMLLSNTLKAALL